MYKKIVIITLISMLVFSTAACDSSTSESTNVDAATEHQDPIKEKLYSFIQNNLGYTITDLRVVAEDDGYHIVINVPGTPNMLQKLCEDSINCVNGYAEENDIAITKINPIILSDNDIAFGWSTSGTLYSSDTYPIAENVSISDITTTLSKTIDMDSYSIPDAEDVAPIADEEIEWEIISTQDYIRNNKECLGYRVYINTDRASDMQYRSIFDEITNDGKYLHTVWFYFSKSSATRSGTADVTMDQTVEGITPLPEK